MKMNEIVEAAIRAGARRYSMRHVERKAIQKTPAWGEMVDKLQGMSDDKRTQFIAKHLPKELNPGKVSPQLAAVEILLKWNQT